MKKLLALVIAAILCAAMVLPVFAAETPTGTLSITNAEHGKTYYVIRVFDAQVSTPAADSPNKTPSVSYTVKDSSEATALFALIKNGTTYKNGNTTILCPFVIDSTHDSGTDAPVSHKIPAEGQSAEFGRGWLYGMYQTKQWVPDANSIKSAALAENQVNTLAFADLPYGYYMVFADDATVASVISITSANAAIIDKNTRTPGDPDKKIKLDTGLVDYTEAEVGDVISYVASFQATNFRTVSTDMQTTKIASYHVSDSAVGLKYKGLTSAAIYRTKNADGTFSGLVKELSVDQEKGDVIYSVEKDSKGNIIGYTADIAWVDKEGNSLYPSPCYVVLTYDMYVTEDALTIANGNTAINTFKPSFRMDTTEIPVVPPKEDPPSAKVYTTGLSIRKIDDANYPLSGAQFKLAKVEGETETFYHLVPQESQVTGEKWNKVEWVEEKDADIVEAQNSSDIQTFGGLKSGTYHLYETKAPEGYYAPATPWTVVISYDDGVFSAQISADGVNFSDMAFASDGTSARNFFAASIVNKGTSPLPQTGAEGTTLLLITGTILFMGTMLILVTKKRMYNQG